MLISRTCRAPILYVKGRQHPVKIFYAVEPVTDYIDAALKTIFQCHMQRPPGDILVFLPGSSASSFQRRTAHAARPQVKKTLKVSRRPSRPTAPTWQRPTHRSPTCVPPLS